MGVYFLLVVLFHQEDDLCWDDAFVGVFKVHVGVDADWEITIRKVCQYKEIKQERERESTDSHKYTRTYVPVPLSR